MINEFLEMSKSHRLKIAVVGDCMVDEWWNGEVSRISPEAPIPIFRTHSWCPNSRQPGGAGNVANQLKRWNVDVELYGILGEETAKMYNDSFGIDTSKCAVHLKVLNPIKKRYMAGDVQVHRIDQERDNFYLSNTLLRQLQIEIGENLIKSDPDVVILSDYAKGVFSNGPWFFPMDHWKKQGKNVPIIVDPKKGPIDLWRGCTIYKPNEREAAALSGISEYCDPKIQPDYFRTNLGCESVVITHGAGGVTGSDRGQYFEYAVPWVNFGEKGHRMAIAPREVKVHSVVGAGDCFLAFLSMAVGLGYNVSEASKIAFEAGAIYVTHRYNCWVCPEELKELDPVDGKIVEARECSSNGILCNGCFDVLHPGHLALLQYAKSLCVGHQKLIVAINSDESVRRLKGESRPIYKQQDRARMLAGLACVDQVVVFDEDTPYELIKKIRPGMIVKGGDYKKEEVVGKDLARVVIFPTVADHSTTGVINKEGV
jgi:D-beta-D-heptose 7-phosphate kinase/D-beta-D-heptose 1-phosphate adenosyltransferase